MDNTLLNDISQFISNVYSDESEIELITKNMKILDKDIKLIEIDYIDEISYILDTPIKNATYRYITSSNDIYILEKKSNVFRMNITDELKLKHSFEINEQINSSDIPFDKDRIKLIIRKQRFSYKFLDSKLKDWRIDKTIRLHTTDFNSKKLSVKLDRDNTFYDKMDLEFEYIGNKCNISKSFIYLLSIIYPNSFEYTNNTYKKIKNLLRNHKINLLNIFPKVSILTNRVMRNNDLHEFVVMRKIDGIRKTLIYYKQRLYSLTNKGFLLITDTRTTQHKSKYIKTIDNTLWIIDSEECDGTYYLIDIYYYIDKIVYNEQYTIKHNLLKEFEKKLKRYVSIETIYPVNLQNRKNLSWKYVIDLLYSKRKLRYDKYTKTDGYIVRKRNELYKVKTKEQSTIDCLLMHNSKNGLLYMYLIGNPKEVCTKEPFEDKLSKEFFGYSLIEKINSKNVYILFATPYENPYTIKIDFPEQYDKKIVEVSFIDKNMEFVPNIIKIRDDKEYPNNYRVGMSIISLLNNWLDSNLITNNKLSINIEYKTIFKYIKQSIISNANILLMTSDSELLSEFHNFLEINECYIVSNSSDVIDESINNIDSNKFRKPFEIITYKQEQSKNLFMNLYYKLVYSKRYTNNSINLICLTDLILFANNTDIKEFIQFINKIHSKDAQLMLYITNIINPKIFEQLIKELNKLYEPHYLTGKEFIWYDL